MTTSCSEHQNHWLSAAAATLHCSFRCPYSPTPPCLYIRAMLHRSVHGDGQPDRAPHSIPHASSRLGTRMQRLMVHVINVWTFYFRFEAAWVDAARVSQYLFEMCSHATDGSSLRTYHAAGCSEFIGKCRVSAGYLWWLRRLQGM